MTCYGPGRPSLLHASLLCVLALACGNGSRDARPNVVLITIDTLRADYLGAYGFGLPTTPHIDALARDAVVFERAIAAAPRTAPAHASMLTSLYPREHSIGYRNGDARLAGKTRLPELFGAAGYQTAAFIGNTTLRRKSGLDLGFDHYDDDLPSTELNRHKIHERIASETNAAARAWLATTGDDPFFLWVHYQDPHGPYTPPEPFEGRIRLEPAPGEQPLEVASNAGGWNAIPGYQALSGLFLPSDYKGRYADEIAFTDEMVGELLREVEERSRDRPHIVLLTSDHGESLGESGRYFTHGYSTTPQVAHVPMILRAPGLEPGRRGEPVSHVDIMPTLLELAGLEPPEGLSGIAWGPFLRDQRPLPERLVYCDVGNEVSAYASESFIRVLGVGGAWEDPAGVKPSCLHFHWRDDSNWEPVDMDERPTDAVAAYVSEAVPIEYVRGMSPEERKALAFLGYLAPEE